MPLKPAAIKAIDGMAVTENRIDMIVKTIVVFGRMTFPAVDSNRLNIQSVELLERIATVQSRWIHQACCKDLLRLTGAGIA